MKLLNKIKGGLKMAIGKTIDTVVGISRALENDRNRIILGLIMMGLSMGLIASGYVPKQQILK